MALSLTVPESDPEARPSEAGHWYAPSGKPRYEVPNKSKPGEMRPATLRDARREGWVPGVSTLTSLIKSGALMDWWGKHVAGTGWSMSVEEEKWSMPPFLAKEAWVANVIDRAGELSAIARDKGTGIHVALESHFLGETVEEAFQPVASAVYATLTKRYGEQHWIAEYAFAHPDGYGGKVDLFCRPVRQRDMAHRLYPNGIVIDFKTADFGADTPSSRYAYPDRAIQLALYAYGVGQPRATLANVLVSTHAGLTEPLVLLHEWKNEDYRWLNAGLALLELWKHLKGYDGSW
jgi:hypothetical protein